MGRISSAASSPLTLLAKTLKLRGAAAPCPLPVAKTQQSALLLDTSTTSCSLRNVQNIRSPLLRLFFPLRKLITYQQFKLSKNQPRFLFKFVCVCVGACVWVCV